MKWRWMGMLCGSSIATPPSYGKYCLSSPTRLHRTVMINTAHGPFFFSFTHLLYSVPTLAPLWLISLTLTTHSSHTYSTSFPHLLHYDSYLSCSWLIAHTLTPLHSHTCSTLTHYPYLYFYYILLKRNIGRCYSDLKPKVPLRNCIGSLRSQDLCKWYHTNCGLVMRSS